MPQLIIHKDGAYNLYSTIVDAPIYESAITLEQLRELTLFDLGQSGIEDLPERLQRAHKTGCSHMAGWTLDDCIAGNRAGINESKLPKDEFIAMYLTLKDQP